MAHHRQKRTLGPVGRLSRLDGLLQFGFLELALGDVAKAEHLALQLTADVQRNAVAFEVAAVGQAEGDEMVGVVAGVLVEVDQGVLAGVQLLVEKGQNVGVDTGHQ